MKSPPHTLTAAYVETPSGGHVMLALSCDDTVVMRFTSARPSVIAAAAWLLEMSEHPAVLGAVWQHDGNDEPVPTVDLDADPVGDRLVAEVETLVPKRD